MTNEVKLPRNVEMERVVLGVLLLSESAEQIREADVTADCFMAFNRETYRALCDLAERGESINPVTLHAELETRGSKVDPAYIAGLYEGVPRFANGAMATEFRKLRDLAALRSIQRHAGHWFQETQARDCDVSALVGRIQTTAADLGAAMPSSASRVSISWADLCEMKFPPRETLLHETERGEVVMCASITNRGKTTLWRNAAISLACGRAFLPLVKTGKPRVVYYLDFETRLPRARADITTMLGKFTVSERALVAQNFHLVADCRIDDLPLSLSNPKHFAIIEADARRVGADVIIVDTVTAGFDMDDENNNSECTRVIKRLIQLAQRLNAVIVFLHHVGKSRQEEGQTPHNVHRARGGSALSGNSTAIFNLLPDPKSDEIVTLECAKVKGEKFDDCLLKLDKEARWFEGAGVGVSGEPAPVPLYNQILNSFNGHALKRAEVIAQFPKLSADTIDRYLKKAVAVGDLIPGKEGRANTYRKREKTDDPHDPQAYRGADNADNREVAENSEDSSGFEWPEDFDQDDHADNPNGDLRFHPDHQDEEVS